MSPRHVVAAAALAVGLVTSSCAPAPPEVPVGADGQRDAVLTEGRDIFGDRCSSCHGSSGGGGRGPELKEGAVIEAFPNVADQIQVVSDGRNQMPSFLGQLSEVQIDAVVRYTREVLS